MANKSITSANSVITITATSRNVATTAAGGTSISAIGALSGLLGVPTTIQGWATDQAFSAEAQNTAEMQLGVDASVHVGWLPYTVPFRLSLMPDSDSQDFMENLATIQVEMRETLMITGVLIMPAVNKKYSLSNGVLTNYTPFAAHNRLLGAQQSSITFAKIIPAAY